MATMIIAAVEIITTFQFIVIVNLLSLSYKGKHTVFIIEICYKICLGCSA